MERFGRLGEDSVVMVGKCWKKCSFGDDRIVLFWLERSLGDVLMVGDL